MVSFGKCRRYTSIWVSASWHYMNLMRWFILYCNPCDLVFVVIINGLIFRKFSKWTLYAMVNFLHSIAWHIFLRQDSLIRHFFLSKYLFFIIKISYLVKKFWLKIYQQAVIFIEKHDRLLEFPKVYQIWLLMMQYQIGNFGGQIMLLHTGARWVHIQIYTQHEPGKYNNIGNWPYCFRDMPWG